MYLQLICACVALDLMSIACYALSHTTTYTISSESTMFEESTINTNLLRFHTKHSQNVKLFKVISVFLHKILNLFLGFFVFLEELWIFRWPYFQLPFPILTSMPKFKRIRRCSQNLEQIKICIIFMLKQTPDRNFDFPILVEYHLDSMYSY